MTDDEAATHLIARAHAERPAAWVDAARFVAHARTVVESEEELSSVLAGDLYFALACADGVPDALAALEREHLARVREFAASVDSAPSFVQELTQQLRARILVATEGRPARIATYSGRGSLGAWIRVAAVRLARDLARVEHEHRTRTETVEAHAIDPELGYLKTAYGEAVSQAVQEALATLDDKPRTLLKMHYVDNLSIEQVGIAFGVSRATAARMLATARATLVEDIRERLAKAVGVKPEEADSLLAFVRSRLDLSLARAFASRS